MEATRAKFRCMGIDLRPGSRPKNDGTRGYEPVVLPTVRLQAVAAHMAPDAEDSEENKRFWEATPSGKIELSISNPDASELFELGRDYFVDFSPC